MGKVVAITGAGVGRATARDFGAHGRLDGQARQEEMFTSRHRDALALGAA